MIYLDCEASGLEDESYPIEIAWLSTSGEQDSFLINPNTASSWDFWSPEAEVIHGIPRDECVQSGISIFDAVQRLNSQLRGEVIYCDAPAFDGFWLARLFAAAQVEPLFQIEHIALYFYDKQLDMKAWHSERSQIKLDHRALSDCKRSLDAGKNLNFW